MAILDTDPNLDPLDLRRRLGSLLSPLTPPILAPGREIPVRTAAAPTSGPTPTTLDLGTGDQGSRPVTAGPRLPSLQPPTLTLPDRNDPKYQALQPHGLKRVGLTLGAALGGPFAPLASKALNAPETAYDRDLEATKDRLTLQDTESQIQEREASARQHDAAADKPESVDQELAAATMDAIGRGADPTQDPKVKNLIAVRNEAAGKTGDAKVKDVKADDQGNAIAVMEDGSTKQLGYKVPPEKTKEPSEEDRAIGDYLAAHKLTDTPENRTNARAALKAAERAPEKSPGEDAFSRGLADSAVKDLATARGADFRYRTMTDSYPKALKGDQQAMLNLLTNHIGMTLGMQKGARITKDILNEATQSAPWLARIGAKFDKQGYLSGVTLTPDQMKSMMDLGVQQRRIAWQQVGESAKQAGVEDRIQLPKDLDQGKGPLNADEARDYLQKAGGDIDKARQMAKQDGRSF